jgi:hypothetical protein
MAVDDLIAFVPQAPPTLTEDLASVQGMPSRLSILGRSRSLERLADFAALEALWIGEVSEAQLERILPCIDPLYLHISGMRVADLEPLARFQRLQGLEIERNARVSDLSFVESLRGLRLLALVGCNQVRDIRPVGALTNLEILDLAGGMWGTFSPTTLDPIRQLRKLRGLSLKSIRVGDQSLEPVAAIPQLEHLELSNQFPTVEFARLSVALPHLSCPLLGPYVEFPWWDGGTRIMVTGKGKPILSLPKDRARLERYVRQFREHQERFRAGG